LKAVIAITKRIIKDSKTSFITLAVVAIVFGTLSVLFFPAIKESGQAFAEILKSMPPEFTKALNITSTDLGNFETYIATRYLGLVGIIIFVIFILGWATRLAHDAEKGTLALVLAQPVRRNETLLAHLFAILLQTLVLILIVAASVLIPAALIGVDVSYLNWLKYSLHLLLTLSAFASLTLAISIIVMSKSKTMAIAGSIFGASYLLDFFSKLVADLENIRYFSLLYYYGDPTELLKNGTLDTTALLIFFVVTIISVTASFLLFKKRDLPNG